MHRRHLLQASAALAAATALPLAGTASASTRTLRASEAVVPVVGAPYPETPVWRYGDGLPGPELRVPRGQPLTVHLDNALQAPTTVHWHGVRLANAMDGVPGLTQSPVAPGGRFDYAFTPPDAGTFWYHSHYRAFEQVERGLSGVLVVEEDHPPAVDRDEVWLLDDWRLTREAVLKEDFGNGHDLSHAGRIGNTVTLNGRIRKEFAVRGGERIRLRLVNACNARGFALRFTGHRPMVIALDGQPVAPHAPEDGVVVLGAAMRVDLMLDCVGSPGQRMEVRDAFYRRRPYVLTELVYGEPTPGRAGTPIEPLAANPLPEPDLDRASQHTVAIEGGAMGGMRGAIHDGRWQDMRTLARQGRMWALEGVSRGPGDHGLPIIDARPGSSHVITLDNRTAFPHPMHLHGHHFRVLSRNGDAVEHRPWRDTVLVFPRERVQVAFHADNPGQWLFHCHVLEHHASGMGAVIRVG